MRTLTKELVVRSIKLIDIAYITFLYFFSGYFIGIYLDKLLSSVFAGDNKNKTSATIMFEVFIELSIIGIISYIGRNLIELIPFPLDGIYGFDHMRVKELKSGGMLTVFIVLFSQSLQDKLMELKRRIMK
jgi:hypothetical protein